MSELVERYLQAIDWRREAEKDGDTYAYDHWDDELDRLWYLMPPEDRSLAETRARKRSGGDDV